MHRSTIITPATYFKATPNNVSTTDSASAADKFSREVQNTNTSVQQCEEAPALLAWHVAQKGTAKSTAGVKQHKLATNKSCKPLAQRIQPRRQCSTSYSPLMFCAATNSRNRQGSPTAAVPRKQLAAASQTCSPLACRVLCHADTAQAACTNHQLN